MSCFENLLLKYTCYGVDAKVSCFVRVSSRPSGCIFFNYGCTRQKYSDDVCESVIYNFRAG